LLSAEIAGQRGAYVPALAAYLDAAVITRNPEIAERAVQIALFLRDSEKAATAVSIWIDEAPDDISARKAAILVYLSLGNQNSALVQIRQWFRMDSAPFREKVANLTKVLGKNPVAALEIMENLSLSYGENTEFLYGYSFLALKANQPAMALAKVNAALDLKPGWEAALTMKGQILSTDLINEQTARELSELAASNPDNARIGFSHGEYLIKKEQYEAARDQFEKVLEADPVKYEAMFRLAGLNLQLGDQDAAREFFLRLSTVPKWASQAFMFLGRIESGLNNHEDALNWYDQVSDGSLEMEAGLNAFLALGKLGRFDEADTRIAALARRYPNQAVRIALVRVELFTKSRLYEKALDVLNSALDKNPSQSELLYSRALVADRLGRLDILEADLSLVLETDPENVNALNALGYALVDKTRRLQEAGKYLDQALKLRPDDPVIIDSYGWLQFKLGNYGQAVVFLRRAFDEHPDPEIAAHLGEVLWVSGRNKEARNIWHKALLDDPESEYLLEIKSRFPKAFVD
jgi:tetratricopeptide (TPR) repeat protein